MQGALSGRIAVCCFVSSCFLVVGIMKTSPLRAVPQDQLTGMQAEIDAAYNTGISEFMNTDDGLMIHYRSFTPPGADACILVLPGRTEPVRKYREFVYDMLQTGYCLILLDWRGQGRSTRLLADRQKGHVEDYSQYIGDLSRFVEEVLQPRYGTKKLYAVAHSMGANVLSLYLADHDKVFDRVVLSSPMLDIPTFIPQRLAWLMARIAEWLDFGHHYVPSHGPFRPDEPNKVSQSDIRRGLEIEMKQKNPDLTVGGATYSWVRASLEATWQMKERAGEISTPILMLQAENDQVVLNQGQDIVCAKAQKCTLEIVPKAGHELIQEIDAIRGPVMQMIRDFLPLNEGDEASSQGS